MDSAFAVLLSLMSASLLYHLSFLCRIWGKGDLLGCSLEALQQEALQLVFLLTDTQQKSKILQEQQQAAVQASVSIQGSLLSNSPDVPNSISHCSM